MSTELDEELTEVQTFVEPNLVPQAQPTQTAQPTATPTKQTDPDEVTLGDKRVELSSFDRYKGRKNMSDRIGIISGSLLRACAHFHGDQKKKQGKLFRCISTPQERKICCQTLGNPRQSFGLVVFSYLVDPNTGALIDPKKCQGKVLVWVISESRYQELTAIHTKWPLLDKGFGTPQHDLGIKCTEEQYQRFNITPEPNAHWKQKDQWYQALKGKEVKAKESLQKALGWRLSEAEVNELLAVSTPGQATGGLTNTADVDLSDIVDEVA